MRPKLTAVFDRGQSATTPCLRLSPSHNCLPEEVHPAGRRSRNVHGHGLYKLQHVTPRPAGHQADLVFVWLAVGSRDD